MLRWLAPALESRRRTTVDCCSEFLCAANAQKPGERNGNLLFGKPSLAKAHPYCIFSAVWAKNPLVRHDASHGIKVTTHHNRSKPFVKEAYLYSHFQQIYLLDKAGRTRAFFFTFTGSPLDEMQQAVLGLLDE